MAVTTPQRGFSRIRDPEVYAIEVFGDLLKEEGKQT